MQPRSSQLKKFLKRNGCARVQLLRTVNFFCERALFRAVVSNWISWAKECSFAEKSQDCQTKFFLQSVIGFICLLLFHLVKKSWRITSIKCQLVKGFKVSLEIMLVNWEGLRKSYEVSRIQTWRRSSWTARGRPQGAVSGKLSQDKILGDWKLHFSGGFNNNQDIFRILKALIML